MKFEPHTGAGSAAASASSAAPEPRPEPFAAPALAIPGVEELARSCRVMIVDDEPINVKVARKYLETDGYQHFTTVTESPKAMEAMRREKPDVVLLDIMMPQVSGLDILGMMREDEKLQHTPVIILTANTDAQTRIQALELGATDFLNKPVDASELLLRLRNVLLAKAYQDHLENYSKQLAEQVNLRTAELEASRQEIIFCLARAAEFRDDDTGRHVVRVGRYAAVIAQQMGFDADYVEMMEQAAQLHDVGKIGIPDSILLKPGKLEADEFEFMQRHCGFGRRIVRPLPEQESVTLRNHVTFGAEIMDLPGSPVLRMASRIAMTHHEKWNGSGYPLGLAGEDIPIEGRITAVADVFDALSSKRPYKDPFPREKCFAILEEGRNQHFDGNVLDAFFARSEQIIETQIEWADID